MCSVNGCDYKQNLASKDGNKSQLNLQLYQHGRLFVYLLICFKKGI